MNRMMNPLQAEVDYRRERLTNEFAAIRYNRLHSRRWHRSHDKARDAS
jgi:hypothetical protein